MHLIRLLSIPLAPVSERLEGNLRVLGESFKGTFPLVEQIENETDETVAVGGTPSSMEHHCAGMIEAVTQDPLTQSPAFLFLVE
jgi:hypothetical protein